MSSSNTKGTNLDETGPTNIDKSTTTTNSTSPKLDIATSPLLRASASLQRRKSSFSLDGDSSQRTTAGSSSSVATTPTGSPLLHAATNYYSNSIDMLPERLTLFDLLGPSSTNGHFTAHINKQYNKVKEKSLSQLNKIKDGTTKRRDKYLHDIKDIEGLKKKLTDRVDKLDKRLNDIFYASTTEKWFYSFAVYSIFVAGFIIGKCPQYFHVYYTALTLILMPIRFYTFWKRSFHYFLFDLCYYVNWLTLIFIWFAPHSKHLYTVCFSFTFGTLSWAVITWRNSLVLHSIEKTTSSFIHVMPPVVMFVITHQLPHDYKVTRFPATAKLTKWNFIFGVIWTSLYYLIWQLSYHYFITIRKAQKIKEGRATSFEWLRKSFAKQWIGRFVNGLPEPFPIVAFTVIQYGYQLLTMSICPVWFRYKSLASLFMTFIFLVATFNGATYYVDYYGKKLEKEVQRLQKEIDELTYHENHEGELINEDMRSENDHNQRTATSSSSSSSVVVISDLIDKN
ncbi:hypothetical protein WICPIJ_002042 [Wickerhamomyces pijperi]|uniref:Glycerophosphocholine acyltransferase 1 n=1 Tax=Wickerhamomyces pijperi TaxID=599730 RepID=A0A9P8TPB3_WICPI|nr:hypothetical protein WICPIJ_002042 [Wickerhamomyces pijperi]